MRQGRPLAGSTSLLRSMNERAVLESIHTAGSIARNDLAARTGLSKQTITLALNSLIKGGVVVEAGRLQGRTGPAAALYRVDPRCGLAIGVDVGSQYVRAAITDIEGTTLASTIARARRRTGTLVAQVRQLSADVSGQVGAELDAVSHVVVGLPAAIRPDGEQLLLGGSLPRAGRGLVAGLRAAIPVPVTVENDINLAAVGEQAHGHGRQVDDFVFLSLGTGPGLGIVVGGQLRRGASGLAGEIGQIPADDWSDGPPVVGKRVDLDRQLSDSSITAAAENAGMPAGSTPREIFDRARSGDQTARGIVDLVARRTAQVIASITPILDPQLVVLGGGIGLNGDLLIDVIDDCLRAAAAFAPKVVTSQLEDRATLWGATEMARSQARESVFAAVAGVGRATIVG